VTASGSRTRRTELFLLSGFELLRDGEPAHLPGSAERLLAFLAVNDHAHMRSHVAGSLWLKASESRSAASLRSALWRVHCIDEHLIEASSTRIRLAPGIRVDLRDGLAVARRLLAPEGDEPPPHAVALLDGELLPDWYGDDWLVLPREQWRQVRLHALEVLAYWYAERDQHAAAVTAALAAVRGEQLRESAHRCLIEVHLAENNVNEAIAEYQRFRRMVNDELGVEPSARLTDLIDGVRRPGRITGRTGTGA
jgi:DNA-binding SARP family transcriptional activator